MKRLVLILALITAIAVPAAIAGNVGDGGGNAPACNSSTRGTYFVYQGYSGVPSPGIYRWTYQCRLTWTLNAPYQWVLLSKVRVG